MRPIQPFHQFKCSVARELEDFWGSANSHALVKEHTNIVLECWMNNQNPIESANAVDRFRLNRSQKMKYVSPIKLALNYNKETGKLE